MNAVPEVKFARDDGAKRQIVKYLLYKRDGLKDTLDSRKGKIASGIAFSIVLTLNLVWDRSEPPETRQPILPNKVVQDTTIELPKYRVEIGAGKAEEAKGLPPSPAARLRGLARVARTSEGSVVPGTMVKARLVSGASNGLVKAVLTEAVRRSGSVLYPEGSILLGTGQSTEERLQVTFAKLVTPDEEVIEISAIACDATDGMPGLKGKATHRGMKQLFAATGLNFSGGAAEALKSRDEDREEDEAPSMKDVALSGASMAALEQAKSLLSGMESMTTVVQVPGGRIHFAFFQ
jgi:type IV secretory pathway VirB10-like protein